MAPGRIQVLQKELDDDGIEAFIEKYGIKLGRVISPLDPKKPAQTLTESVINLVVPEYWEEENEKIILRLRDGKTIESIKKAVNDKGRKRIMDNKANIIARDKAIAEFSKQKPKRKPIINVKKEKTKEKPTFAQIEKETRIIPPQLTLKDRTLQVKERRNKGVVVNLPPGGKYKTEIIGDGNIWDDVTIVQEPITYLETSRVGQTTPAGAKFSYGWAEDAVDDIMYLIFRNFYEELRVDDENDGLLTEEELEDNIKYRNEQIIIKKELEEMRNINIQTMKRLRRRLMEARGERMYMKRIGRQDILSLISDRDKGFQRGNMDLDMITEIPRQTHRDNINREFNSFIDGVASFKGISRIEAIPLIENRRIKIIEEKEAEEAEKARFEEEYKRYKLLKLRQDVRFDNIENTLLPENTDGVRNSMIFYIRRKLEYLDPDFNMADDDENTEDDEELEILEEDWEKADVFNYRYVEELKRSEEDMYQAGVEQIERERIAKENRREIRREKRKKEKAREILEEAKRKREEAKRKRAAEEAKKKLDVYDDKEKERRYQLYVLVNEAFEEAQENLEEKPDDEDYQDTFDSEEKDLDNFFEDDEEEEGWPEDFEERYNRTT